MFSFLTEVLSLHYLDSEIKLKYYSRRNVLTFCSNFISAYLLVATTGPSPLILTISCATTHLLSSHVNPISHAPFQGGPRSLALPFAHHPPGQGGALRTDLTPYRSENPWYSANARCSGQCAGKRTQESRWKPWRSQRDASGPTTGGARETEEAFP